MCVADKCLCPVNLHLDHPGSDGNITHTILFIQCLEVGVTNKENKVNNTLMNTQSVRVINTFRSTLENVQHVLHVIHVEYMCGFGCIAHVIHTPAIHV